MDAAKLLYAPSPQDVHAPVPVVRSLYVPDTQAVQTKEVFAATGAPYRPAAHMVHAAEVLPAERPVYVPATQPVHTIEV